MKRIAVYFDEPEFADYPFTIDLYRKVYRELAQTMERLGGEFYIVRGSETFLGRGVFRHGWKYQSGSFLYVGIPVQCDVIWNKGNLVPDRRTRMVNDPRLDAIACNKWVSYQWFFHLHARTFLVKESDGWRSAMRLMRTQKVVVKPLMGYGGEGIVVDEKSNLKQANVLPCIMQEFIDTSCGIPGLVEGMHDLRVIVIDGEVSLSYIRTPPAGRYTANVSQGGKEIEVPQSKIPKGVLDIVRQVDEKINFIPHRLYTVDMGLDVSGRWVLFEINSKPGFSPMETGQSYPIFYKKLCTFFLSVPTLCREQAFALMR